jgi:putative ABC transport system substrate-binding protein
MDPADPAALPTSRSLARGPQTACYLPWLKVSAASGACSASRGHLTRGARSGSTFHGSWQSRIAFARADGSTEPEDAVIDRRTFLAGTGAVLLAAPLGAEAQQAAKVSRIGYLAGNLAAAPRLEEALRQGLRDLGYVEGRNVVIEIRDAEGKPERLPALAAELVALKVDVIVAPNTPQALAAKQATRTLPIVFSFVADPVASGLITSLARPGGNVTGLSSLTRELVGKRLELLTQAVPGVRRVAVLWQPGFQGERTDKDMLKAADVAARALGVRLQVVEVRGPADFDKAFSDMTRAHAGAVTVMGSTTIISERTRLVDLAAKHRLPAVFGRREYVDAGGLMAYGSNIADLFRRTATYVDKILKGAKPADLPVEQPTKFELVINLKTAKALGLTIPQSVLGRADEIIQ